MRKCDVPGCERIHAAKGLCLMHYKRRWRHGSVDKPLGRKKVYKHGHAMLESGRPSGTYFTWTAMKQRCTNPNAPNYGRYGGRGVSICRRWLRSFSDFLNDVGERPEGKTLDRIDPDGNYEPGNVRWSTPKEQANNRRNTR